MVDIEATLIAWLNKNSSVKWYGDVPSKRPERFGTLERTGGGVSDVVIDSPSVALQVWGSSRSDAKTLAIEICELLPSFVREAGVRKVEIVSVYNFPDDTANVARYQITAQFKTV